MRTLIPRDNWEHNVIDLVDGVIAALRPRKQDRTVDLPEVGRCLPMKSGRAALVTALKALKMPPGARVGVPLFCCPVVFDAIQAAGCQVCFIDIDPATFCLSPTDLSAKSAELDAVIAVHMFGNACDMSKLVHAADGKPIIEDCAQALGTRHDGRPVGSFGAIAVFSFRSGKYISAGEGGALYSRSTDTVARATELISATQIPSRADECVRVASSYLKSVLRRRPLYGLVGYPLWQTWSKSRTVSATPCVSLGRIYKTDLHIATRRFAMLPAAIERQRAIADYYSRALAMDPQMLCSERPGAYYNRYLYPITFPSSDCRNEMASYLHRRSIDSMKYLDDVVSLAKQHYGYAGNCPMAEQLSKRVLVVPGYYSLKQSDVEHIVANLNAGWAELACSRGSARQALPDRQPLRESKA